MLQAVSITIREGFEAALVIAIMLTYAVKSGRSYLRRPVIWGAVSAAAASVLAALALRGMGSASENPAVEGFVYVFAALLVLSMVVWMWRAGSGVQNRIASGMDRADAGSAAGSWGVAVVAFVMVARESVEMMLFMAANVLDRGLVPTLIGGAMGLALAFGLGAAVYYGAARVDLKLFFAASSAALLLLASRFLGLGVLELSEAGLIALPETIADGLELLDEGALTTIVSVIVVALPLGALGWSFLRRHTTNSPRPA